MRAKQTLAAGEPDAAAAASGFVLRDGDLAADAAFAGFAAADWNSDPETLITEVLAIHNVSAALAERVIEAVRTLEDRSAGDPLADLAAGLAACLSFAPFGKLWSGGSVALVGPPGAGKTTLAAKLAARARRGHPMLLNTDTRRSGAQAQLAEYAGIIGADLRSADDSETIARTLRGDTRRLIIDTSGVNPFDGGAMLRLAAIVNAARAEPILVLPANIEREEAIAFVAAFRALPIRRLVMTRLDIVRRLGGILAAIEAGGYDLIGGSITPHFAYGLRPLTPLVLARRLMSAALDGRRWRTA